MASSAIPGHFLILFILSKLIADINLPFLIKDGSKKYVLLPKDTNNYQYDSWALMDEQGKTVKDNIPGSTELNGQPLYLGYPDESTDFNRIYDIKDLK